MGYSHLNLAAVVLAGFVSVSTTTAQAPRVDLHGDPLPPGVLARLGTVRLRHVPSGGSGIHGIFRPDSRAILTANEYSVRLWDARTGKRLWHLATRGFINSVCFAPDGKTVAVATGGAILLVDAATGKQRHRLGAKAVEYTRLAFAPDGELLAAICNEKPRGVELYDPGSGKQVGHLQTDGPTPYRLAFTPDGKTLTAWGRVAENDPRKVRLLHFDVGTRKQRDVVTIEAATYGGGLAPDGRTLATRDSQTRHLQLWETVTGRTLGELPERTDYWNFTPDSTKVVTVRFGEGDGKNDARLTVWDVATRKPVLRHTCPKRLAASPSFAPDGKSFLFVFHNRLMHLRDAATGKRLLNFAAPSGCRCRCAAARPTTPRGPAARGSSPTASAAAGRSTP